MKSGQIIEGYTRQLMDLARPGDLLIKDSGKARIGDIIAKCVNMDGFHVQPWDTETTEVWNCSIRLVKLTTRKDAQP